MARSNVLRMITHTSGHYSYVALPPAMVTVVKLCSLSGFRRLCLALGNTLCCNPLCNTEEIPQQ